MRWVAKEYSGKPAKNWVIAFALVFFISGLKVVGGRPNDAGQLGAIVSKVKVLINSKR